MAETIRLNKVLRELNISLDRAVEFLDSKGIDIEKRPTTKISQETFDVLSGEFQTDANKKMASQEVSEAKQKEKEALRVQREQEIEVKEKEKAEREAKAAEVVKAKSTLSGPKQVGKIDLDADKKKAEKPKEEAPVAKPEVKAEVAPKVEEKPKEVEAKKPEVQVKKRRHAIFKIC